MRRFKFNSKVGRSDGLNAFRTKGNHFYDLSGYYRTLYESGRTDLIDESVRSECTMHATFGGSGYDHERMYAFYESLPRLGKCLPSWINDYCSEEVGVWTHYHVIGAGRIFRDKEEFYEFYIPVYWDISPLSTVDLSARANNLMEQCGLKSMPMYNLAYRVLKDKRRVLYARIAWLKTFGMGCDLINYYEMASKRSFKKVYGF